MTSRAARAALVLAALALPLSACQTGPAGSGRGSSSPSTDASTASGDGAATSAGAFPVTIEHAFGETTIASDPQRVVTVGWSDHDMVAAVGEVPVGATKITWGGNDAGSTDAFDEAVTELGASPEDVVRLDDSDGIQTDEIAALEPDLILGTNSGLTQEDYDALSKIAPVVAYPEAPWATPWRDSVEMVGRALGREDEAEQAVAETEKAIADAAAAHPELEGTSIAWGSFTPTDLSTITLYATTDLRPQIFRELGMVDADVVTEGSTAGAFSFNLSAEQADTLDADVLVFYTDGGVDPEALLDDPLVGQIPALRSGAYVAAETGQAVQGLSSPSPLSIPVAMEEFVPLVAQAAAKAKG